ncbi:MAG: hypothetical protein CHACPFDD_04168 [Phycisphaerae bacterium]|nr:hypothetical protein [Phycisphaerae bacterium]
MPAIDHGRISVQSILRAVIPAAASVALLLAATNSPRFAPDGNVTNDASPVALRAGTAADADAETASVVISFNHHVRPILAENCYQCHGPDERARKAGLRLDTAEGATAVLKSGVVAVRPSEPAKSALLDRIRQHDPREIMPPPATGKHLTDEQVRTLESWISAGAKYERHWSLIPPQRPTPPAAADGSEALGAIDAFVRARQRAARLEPNGEADRRTLIRRLSLDLTGLPPTPEEVGAFLADESPDAYERLVDRLLASPRFGERMALEWTDAARYADTNGYHIDNERSMWRWRDWVIDAFNRNMPFDQFTIEQFAGDLLPEATLSQRIATGFHRNHMINFEGGAIDEEYLNEYLVNRVNTTATVWLGLTMNCAQCHDHKYDPLAMDDFYRFYAFFNTLPEKGLDGQKGNSIPFIRAPQEAQQEQWDRAGARLKELETRLAGPMPETDTAQQAWQGPAAQRERDAWTILRPLAATSTGGSVLTAQPDGAVLASGPLPDRETYEIVCVSNVAEIGAVRVEALSDASLPDGGPGRPSFANFVLSEIELERIAPANPAQSEPIKFVAAHADHSQPRFHVSRAIDGDLKTGWAVEHPKRGSDRIAVFVPEKPFGDAGGSVLRFRLRFESDYAQHSIGRVRLAVCGARERRERLLPAELGVWHVAGPFATGETADRAAFEKAFPPESGVDLSAAYGEKGEIRWVARPELKDGVPQPSPAPSYSATYYYRTVRSPQERHMRLSLGSDDGIVVWLNGKVVHRSDTPRPLAPDQDSVELALPAGESRLLIKVVNYSGGFGLYFARMEDDALEIPLAVGRCLELPEEQRNEAQQSRIRDFYRAAHSAEWRAVRDEFTAAETEFKKLEAEIPTTMVMSDAEKPRKTFVLTRGAYDKPEREVSAGVPAALPPLPDGEPANRLTLARWLVSRDQPLTARVTVNRLWQMLFGIGIVRTAEDFGTQGEWPSHPELLDWLAVEFVESGWDVKHMLKLMVMSRTYRQSAVVSPESLAADPENRLLSRHPRLRLSAEGVRDNALAISGLLVEKLGGASVRPYQPPGLWEEMAIDPDGSEFSAQVYKQDSGDALYRRSLYVFRKRTVPHPALQIFDAPSREVCTVRRARTNTPLQALVLMNDPTYVEAARHFARRMLRAGSDDAARLTAGFELALARPPSEPELRVLSELCAAERRHFAADSDAAAKLLGIGESPRDETLDAGEHAAWTMVASAIMNLDQAITKE